MIDDLKWMVGVGLTVLLFLLSLMWGMLESRRAKFEARMEQWMADREKEDRVFRRDEYQRAVGDLNRTDGELNARFHALDERVKTLEREQVKTEDWKHGTVDPYIPRAIEEHERRLNRLDAKVFSV